MNTTPNVLFYTINDGHQDYLDCIEILNMTQIMAKIGINHNRI
jgi:hypothetical protein